MEKKTTPIVGFEKTYLATESGMIYSVRSKKFLRLTKDGRGYLTARIGGSTKKIHTLIAKTFINNPLNKPQINHIDGDKTNNNVSNLEWCTAKENSMHAFNIGIRSGNKGESHPLRKLHETDILIIREAWEVFGYGSQSKMANYYKVQFSIISAICRKAKWNHV